MDKGFKLSRRGDLAFLYIPSFEATGQVTHCFTTRLGGFSEAPYENLNLALHVGDDPQTVITNRQVICSNLGINPLDLVAAEQVHGAEVKVITSEDLGRGAKDYSQTIKATDALITKEKGIPLSTYYADCTPIFTLDPTIPAIGLAHAGWKGTVLKIGAKTIKLMQAEFGSKPENCLIGIGPSIGPCCYEVDHRVVEKLAANFEEYNRFLKPQAKGKWLLDLWQANAYSLKEVGVKEENISFSGYCTNCHPDLFFSYRAEAGITGRMAALMMLK